jgi:hypothetical protein
VAATASIAFFTNPHATLCGDINSCHLKVAGCGSDYTNGHLTINEVTGEVTAKNDIDAGYVDTVCIKCLNSHRSDITFDNWTVSQKPNCETLTANRMAPKEYAYDTAATTTSVYIDSDVFTNSKSVAPSGKPWSVCPITACTLKQSDCKSALVTPFDSLLSIDAKSPWALRISQT